MSLTDKTILVSGGDRGIGLAIALRAAGDVGSLDGWTLKFSLGEHPE